MDSFYGLSGCAQNTGGNKSFASSTPTVNGGSKRGSNLDSSVVSTGPDTTVTNSQPAQGFKLSNSKGAQSLKLGKNKNKSRVGDSKILRINWSIYGPPQAVQACTWRAVTPQVSRRVPKAPAHTGRTFKVRPMTARRFAGLTSPLEFAAAKLQRQLEHDEWLKGLRLKGAAILRQHEEHKRARAVHKALLESQLIGLTNQWAKTSQYWEAHHGAKSHRRARRKPSPNSPYKERKSVLRHTNWLAEVPVIPIHPFHWVEQIGGATGRHRRVVENTTPLPFEKEGYCYLRGFTPKYWAQASRLGPNPKVGAILALAFTAIYYGGLSLDNFDLIKTGMTAGGQFIYHLKPSFYGKSFLSRLSVVHRDSLVGSDEKARPVASRTTPPIEALGGVCMVPTLLPPTNKSAGFDRAWNSRLWPTQATSGRSEWRETDGNRSVCAIRTSEFVYHYPSELNNPRLPEHFTDDLVGRWAYRPEEGDNFDRLFVATDYSRNFRPVPVDRTVRPEFDAIAEILSGSLDLKKLDEADKVAAFSRALGSRGQRIIPGWEAGAIPRWQRVRDYAVGAMETRQYYEFAYRMMSRFISARVVSALAERIPGYHLHVDDTTAGVAILHINADIVAGAQAAPGGQPNPPINQEAPMWTYNALQLLTTGRAQFIDAEGMSREEIAQTIGCLAESNRARTPYLRRPARNQGGQAGPANPRRQWDSYVWNMLRHTYPNDVEFIFVHHGSSPLPALADQQWIDAHAFDVPDSTILSSLIRLYSSRHDLSDTFEEAYQAVIYRSLAYKYADIRGGNDNLRTNDFIDAGGSDRLYLPRNNTRAAYFDIFFMPTSMTDELEITLARTSHELTQIGTLLSHCKAVSINWAAKSLSMLGMSWSAVAAGGRQYLRNHLDKWLRHYYDESLNLWSSVHANAMGTQFGFSQPAIARATEQGRIRGWWTAHAAPYMANHYLELWAMQAMPTFQVLPYYDPEGRTSHVQWPPDTPRPAQSWVSFNQDRNAKVAREVQPFPGFGWLGDGGADYNLQFYVAQGHDGQWAKEGGAHKASLRWYEGEYIHSMPAAPNAANLVPLGPANTPWADFLTPGSVRSYSIDNNRIINWAVTENPRDRLTHMEAHRWWQATMGKPHRSLMVNYVSPITERYEIDALADYSVTIWEAGNQFAGVTFSNFTQEIQKANGRFDDLRPPQRPFESHFDSRPSKFSSHQPSLSTRKEKTSRKSEEKLAPDTMHFTSMSFRRQPSTEDGDLEFENKYPHNSSETPDLREGHVEHAEDGFRSSDQPLPRPKITDLHRKLEEYKAMMDEEFEKYLKSTKRVRWEEGKAEKERARSEKSESAGSSSRTRPSGRRSAKEPRKSEKPPPIASPGKKEGVRGNDKYHAEAKKRTDTEGGLATNDSAAPSAQNSLTEQAAHLLKLMKNITSEASRKAGSRRSTSPTSSRSSSPSASDNEYETASDHESDTEVKDNPDHYSEPNLDDHVYEKTDSKSSKPPSKDPNSVKPPKQQYHDGGGGSALGDYSSSFHATMSGGALGSKAKLGKSRISTKN